MPTLELISETDTRQADFFTSDDPAVKDLLDQAWLWQVAARCVPQEIEPIVEWASKFVKLYGEDGVDYSPEKSPWSVYPLSLCADPEVATVTYIKPVQTGGTTVGEIAIMYRILTSSGLILYNWPTDDKAADRWDKYTEKRIKSCPPIRRILPAVGIGADRSKLQKGFISFANITFCQQGVSASGNLDSDSVGFMVNEEIHNWEAGRMIKAKGRQTRVAFPKMINISNAGMKGDQLDEEWESGTQQELEVRCPGCKGWHQMRTRWEDRRPELGGLRYDSTECKYENGTFNYNKLVPTIHYQMPCGYKVPNDIVARRALCSLENLRYSDPKNEGALLSNRSLRHQAVICHNISWVDLIQQKHLALRALRSGDEKPFIKYLQERECIFYSREHQPFEGEIVISSGIQKNREGLAPRAARLWMADWQQGYKHLGQLEHFWLVIEDVLADCNSQIVWEGMVASENELFAILQEHDAIEHGSGLIDCSKNTKHLLEFCYRNKFHAIMSNASHRGLFRHREDNVQRFYDEGTTICGRLNVAPIYHPTPTKEGWAPDPREPVVINVNKAGMIANHFFIREHQQRVQASAKEEGREAAPAEYISRVIPDDVSEDFRQHYAAWVRVDKNVKRRTDEVMIGAERFQQIRQNDHLLMCLAGIDMLKDWSGLLGERLEQLGIREPAKGKQ